MSSEDLDDLAALVRALLVVWDRHRRGPRPVRKQLVVVLLMEVDFDRSRLDWLLARYGSDLLGAFRAAAQDARVHGVVAPT